MNKLRNLTLGQIVKRDCRTAAVFEKFSLDFWCGGGDPFEHACHAADVDPALVAKELEGILIDQDGSTDFDAWPLHVLMDYIVERHHAYIVEKTPQIKRHLDKIIDVHAHGHPELREIRALFFEIAGELAIHLKKEEIMVFPFIRNIERAQVTNGRAVSPLFNSVHFPIGLMTKDHEREGAKFGSIAKLTGHYSIPPHASRTFMTTYHLLRDFERDLHIHIHLENNILFPKAVALEEQLNVIK